jgi:hypothetical protein
MLGKLLGRGKLLGGAVLVALVLVLSASAALAADMIKVQGESMTLATGISVVSDSNAEPTGAGKAIRYSANATARKSVTYTKGASQIVVRARKDGTNAQHPLLKVYTKTGTQTPVLRGSATVSSTSYREYTFPFSASSGTHQIQVRAANIGSGKLLRVDYFRIPESTSTTLPTHQAQRAERFTDTTSVATHFAFNGSGYATGFADLKSALCDMDGVENIRDNAVLYGDSRDTAIYDRYKALFNDCGIRTTLLVDFDFENMNPPTSQKINQMLALGGGAIAAWEGPNEWNNTNKGGNNPDWATELFQFQQQLFAAVNASQQPGIPVLCPSINAIVDGVKVDLSKVPDMGAYCDVNNIHNYPGGNPPTWGNPGIDEQGNSLFDLNMPIGDHVGDPNYATYLTETGYHHSLTYPNGNGVPEDIMAEYEPMLWAEYFNASFDPDHPGTSLVRTSINQLYDNITGTTPQANYGMIETDFRRKANYKSLENMLDIVADPATNAATFTSGSLSYDIIGESAQVHTILLQKANGKFYLMMWQEDRRYDWRDSSERYITVAAENVTVDFQGTPDVKVYSPVEIAWSSGASALSSPKRTLLNAGSVTEPIDTKMKVFEITP